MNSISLGIVRLIPAVSLLPTAVLLGCVVAPASDTSSVPIARVVTKTEFATGGYINNRTYYPFIGPVTDLALAELWRPTVHYRYAVQFASGRLVSLETTNEAKVGECVWVQLPRESSQLAAFSLGQADLRSGAPCTQLPAIDG